MDDVDAVHGQIARNMVQSGDWVIAHLNGVPYMEKAPLPYWLIAICYVLMGVHDWVARIPTALAAVLLCFATARYGAWAFGRRAGFYAGLALATCIGLFLFTRILIPDVMLTLTITVCFMAFERAMNEDGEELHAHRWPALIGVALGMGVLLKGLLALVVPIGGALVYLAITRQLFSRDTWRKLRPISIILIFLLIAAPWHVLATLRMPPYFNFSMHSGPGEYHGFFWFYFFNEHLLRFLNLRYPRDYNTVPRPLFWLLHFAWFFPWSAFLVPAFRLRYRGADRASRVRLLCLCWIGTVLGFFTFSTTQEYYSMPAYPAFAILIGSAMAEAKERGWRWAMRTTGLVAALALAAIAGLLWMSREYAAPGDIAQALSSNPGNYTLSLGHMGNLTLRSFAYLRTPLAIAGLAMLVGAVGVWDRSRRRAALSLAVMMVLFFQAARLALIAFDPYLGSYTLAEALNKAPAGGLIVDNPYYEFSSIFFYTNKTGLMLNGRRNNLEYGSYAPGAPDVFIGDAGFIERWNGPGRWYVASEDEHVDRLRKLVGADALHPIASAGGKTIYVNHR